MNRIPVESSNLVSAGWGSNTLEVEFKGSSGKPNSIYAYDGVPQEVYMNLMNADSKGQFLAKYIKPVYPHRRIA